MYKIIGADGREYGPISVEVLRKWIAEGRANAQTKVLAEGATEWLTVAQVPELSGSQPALPTTPVEAHYAPAAGTAPDVLNGPGIGLMVAGGVNILLGLARMMLGVLHTTLVNLAADGGASAELERVLTQMGGVTGLALGALGAACGGVTFYAGLKLRRAESYGLCMTGAILAMIPCTSPCCLIGLPLGIWALVVMSKADTKARFH